MHGLRLDQAISRLFGLSRTAAAALVEAGDALVDGVARPKSDKVSAGDWLEVTLPPPAGATGGGADAGRRPGRGATATTTSSWSTSRSGWPRTPARAGPARP